MPTHLEVRRTDPSETTVTDDEEPELTDGQVRVAIDRIALTANNITYALMGDALDYWAFFPATDGSWGRIPAMGFGDVVASAHPEVAEGVRLYGWFPMSTSVVLEPERRREALVDRVAHRAGHAPIYRTYVPTSLDPSYDAALEDHDALLRGLYATAWLIDAKLTADHDELETVVVTSASSKTSLGVAHRRAAAGRPGRTVGVTSPRNVEEVVARDVYDHVVTYDDAAEVSVAGPTAIVDIAGNADALAALHGALAADLVASLTVGMSHGAPSAAADGLPGPAPEFFFAPTEVERQTSTHGRDAYLQRLGEDRVAFTRWAAEWLEIETAQDTGAAQAAYQRVRAGEVPATSGVILRPSAW